MMQFILVPIIFGLAFLLLGLGKLLGRKDSLHSCSSDGDGEECSTCASFDVEFYQSKDDPGFTNVAQLGNPNRKNRFVEELDFKPERFK